MTFPAYLCSAQAITTLPSSYTPSHQTLFLFVSISGIRFHPYVLNRWQFWFLKRRSLCSGALQWFQCSEGASEKIRVPDHLWQDNPLRPAWVTWALISKSNTHNRKGSLELSFQHTQAERGGSGKFEASSDCTVRVHLWISKQWKLTFCLSYISIALIKHHDQRVYFIL